MVFGLHMLVDIVANGLFIRFLGMGVLLLSSVFAVEIDRP